MVKLFIEEKIKEQTPRANNRCKKLRCKGEVVRRVQGRSRGRLFYGLPTCDTCNRMYLFAKDVRRVGGQEFLALLKIPLRS